MPRKANVLTFRYALGKFALEGQHVAAESLCIGDKLKAVSPVVPIAPDQDVAMAPIETQAEVQPNDPDAPLAKPVIKPNTKSASQSISLSASQSLSSNRLPYNQKVVICFLLETHKYIPRLALIGQAVWIREATVCTVLCLREVLYFLSLTRARGEHIQGTAIKFEKSTFEPFLLSLPQSQSSNHTLNQSVSKPVNFFENKKSTYLDIYKWEESGCVLNLSDDDVSFLNTTASTLTARAVLNSVHAGCETNNALKKNHSPYNGIREGGGCRKDHYQI